MALFTLPLIFKALSAAPALFEAGKSIYNSVTGQTDETQAPGVLDTPDSLAEAVEALPAEKQGRFIEAMGQEIERYRVETERLVIEQGKVNAETLSALPPAAAGKIATLRMATRPLTAKWAFFGVVMLPAYAIVADVVGIYINWVLTFVCWMASAEGLPPAFPMIAQRLFAPNSGFIEVYQWAAPTATTIVITYMTLRQIGKAKGTDTDTASIGQIASTVTGLIGAFRRR